MWSEKWFPNPSFSPLFGFCRRRFSGAWVTVISIPSPFERFSGAIRRRAIDARTALFLYRKPVDSERCAVSTIFAQGFTVRRHPVRRNPLGVSPGGV